MTSTAIPVASWKKLPRSRGSSSHLTCWREMDSVLRRSQTTQKTQRFRHSRCGDKKGFVPGFVPESRFGVYPGSRSRTPLRSVYLDNMHSFGL